MRHCACLYITGQFFKTAVQNFFNLVTLTRSVLNKRMPWRRARFHGRMSSVGVPFLDGLGPPLGRFTQLLKLSRLTENFANIVLFI